MHLYLMQINNSFIQTYWILNLREFFKNPHHNLPSFPLLSILASFTSAPNCTGASLSACTLAYCYYYHYQQCLYFVLLSMYNKLPLFLSSTQTKTLNTIPSHLSSPFVAHCFLLSMLLAVVAFVFLKLQLFVSL